MTIQDSAQGTALVAPISRLPVVDPKTGIATGTTQLFLQQIYQFLNGVNRLMPCNAAMQSNTIGLTLLSAQPKLIQYISYDGFAFTAPANSTGPVTAYVQTTTGPLPTLNVYRQSGAQADSGDIKQDVLYRFLFNDSANSGQGGFVIDSLTVVPIAAPTIATVTGTGDDAHINSNFAALETAVNDLRAAIGAT